MGNFEFQIVGRLINLIQDLVGGLVKIWILWILLWEVCFQLRKG